jgi:hypothetical protein
MKFQLTCHRNLWNWLADNPDKRKNDWPGWEKYIDPSDGLWCFACNPDGAANDCEHECPLIWPGGCCVDDENFGLFNIWEGCNDIDTRFKLARLIANLPVREGVEYE